MNIVGCVAPQLQVGSADGGSWASSTAAGAEVGPSLETFPSQRTADRKHKELAATKHVEVDPPPTPPRASSVELEPPPLLPRSITTSTRAMNELEPPPVPARASSKPTRTFDEAVVKAVHQSEPKAPAELPRSVDKFASRTESMKATPMPAVSGERFAANWEPTTPNAPPPRIQEGPASVDPMPGEMPVMEGCASCADGGDKQHPRYQNGKHPWAKGCFKCSLPHMSREIPVREVPKEGALVNTPPYIIETPDILLIESARSLPDQPIEGEHLVRMDGTINLGVYGAVRVAGLTIDEARDVVQRHLARYIRDPQVNLDVYAYNSKFYYIIADGAGFGWQVTRVNFTGNETVLDAISLLGGLPSVSSKRLWIARPDPGDPKNSLILPVDWLAIIQCGEAATNYQLFPGDRLFVASDRLIKFDSMVAKIITPAERMMSMALLTGLTISRYQNLGRYINVFTNGLVIP
ncbi:MAG: polysaccharide biosynthesis/export family protein [Gemmataceae bacterium]